MHPNESADKLLQIAEVTFRNRARSIFEKFDSNIKPLFYFFAAQKDLAISGPSTFFYPIEASYNRLAKSEMTNAVQWVLASAPHAPSALAEEAKIHIGKNINRFNDVIRFVGHPCDIDGYLVFPVLELSKDQVDEYYYLTNEKSGILPLTQSLIHGTAEVFMEECTNKLALTSGIPDFRDQDEVIREGAKKLLNTVSETSCSNRCDLFNTLNTISSLKYEGKDGVGSVVFTREGHENVRYTLTLGTPINISDGRKVRKFLELAGDGKSVISDGEFIYGLGVIVGNYNSKRENLFVVELYKHYCWRLLHDNKTLMTVEYLRPDVVKEKLDKDIFVSTLGRVFKGLNKSKINALWDIVLLATEQKHGTMLVISEDAKQESDRLANQAFSIAPLQLDKNNLLSLTAIDGCLLLDTSGVCYAIGVILDGLASDKGDSSRGARFNSAIRYWYTFGSKIPTVIVIVSEDGMINIVPNHKPRIKHSDVTDRIDALALLVGAAYSRREFVILMSYFEENSFYLTAEEVQRINKIRQDIDSQQGEDGTGKYQDFKPNEEMNDTYYL